MIRSVTLNDAKDITKIYNHYIKNSIVTFEEVEIDESEMARRIKETTEKFPWIVFEEEGRVLGYAYVGTFRSRSAFNNTVESSIYLDSTYQGKGIGKLLYKELIEICKDRGFHTILGVVTLPNEKSLLLHEKLGFEKVAHFKEVGFKFNTWIDVGSWQLLLK